VSIDYDTMLIELYNTRRSTLDFAGQAFEVEVQGTVIFATATAVVAGGETFTGKVLVDTGSGGTLTFNAPFAKANGLVEKIGSYHERETLSLSTDRARLYTGMLSSISLGAFQFNSVPAGIAVAEAGAFSWPRIMGILGNGILRRFNLSIDLQQKKMFLKPNQAYGDVFEINCSGLELVLDATFSKVIVDRVYPQSPAGAAGLKVGDAIVQIDKDRRLLESMLTHDADFLIFHPDSKSTIAGWEPFVKLFDRWMDPQSCLYHLRSQS
jgi:S1-C subfamily serine protease